MAGIKIPEQIKESVEIIVNEFNETKLVEFNCKFVAEYKGNFLYLLLDEGLPKLAPTLRMKFKGSMDNWEFAIFKWSNETYTTDYFFIPGCKHVNGSISSALQAAIIAYPPRKNNGKKSGNIFINFFKITKN